jgi:glycosyltransferase involved in cell wall biosynthesis
MRIAMVSTPFLSVPPVRYGGTELVVWDLVDGLVERGHEVTLFATGDSRTRAPVEALFLGPSWPPEPYRELAHCSFAIRRILVSAPPYDIIHAHTPALLAFAPYTDVPLVYTVHHADDDGLRDFYQRCPPAQLVAISRRQRELLAPEDDPGVAVVHHGLDVTRYPIGPGGDGVVFLGRLAREKGPAVAIDAARAAGLAIRVAGRPHWADGDYYRAEIVPRLATPGVEYVGEVDHRQKCALLGAAQATLCPVDWEEPFGLVLIESMLCGTPVVAFDRGSVQEIVDPGLTGFIVRNVADMTRLLQRGEVTRLDRRRCRDHAARRFGRARMIEDYLAVYEKARAGARSAAEEARRVDLAQLHP